MGTRKLLLHALFSFLLIVVSGEDVTVTTKNGAVKGERIHFTYGPTPIVDTNMDVFRSIPFAKPPLGDLRFKKPEAVEDWSGTYDATYYRPRCWQEQNENSSVPQDEDCLYLNIWSPDVTVGYYSLYMRGCIIYSVYIEVYSKSVDRCLYIFLHLILYSAMMSSIKKIVPLLKCCNM